MLRFRSIVVLTGAGVAEESGVPTFHDKRWRWRGRRMSEVATDEAFWRDPDLVHSFYNERRRQLLDGSVQPNGTHEALAIIERRFHGRFLLITQNVDNLHKRAGSRKVVHTHGEILKARCVRSGKVRSIKGDLSAESRCSCCRKPRPLRPHVVWFDERPQFLPELHNALEHCDMFVAIGTSNQAYPATAFAEVAAASGAHTVLLNREPPSTPTSLFTEKRYGKTSQLAGALAARLLDR